MGTQTEITYTRRRIATFDLGTNSLLMLVAERDEKGQITVLADESAIPRLGEGLRRTGRIAPQAVERTCRALTELKTSAGRWNVDEKIVTGTSAVREASNQKEFLQRVQERTGVDIQILPPNEEARLTYLSIAMEQNHNEPSLVVDIGGGSTEISWGVGTRFDGGRSLDLGTVKLLEGRLSADPIPSKDLESARKEIDDRLAQISPLGTFSHYYGTAGAFTHLAAVDQGLKDYHPNRVAGHLLTEKSVSRWLEKLAPMRRYERLSLPGIDPRRVDVIVPGTLVIERLFEKLGNDSFEVHDRGVRFGSLYDRLQHFVPPIRFA